MKPFGACHPKKTQGLIKKHPVEQRRDFGEVVLGEVVWGGRGGRTDTPTEASMVLGVGEGWRTKRS